MEVILIKDVVNLGKEGDVTKVRDGYARNFLFPQNIAIPATDQALTANKARAEKRRKNEEKIAKEMQAVADKLSGSAIVIRADVGEEGKLFGSVTATEIAKEIKGQLGIEVDRRKVELEEPIKMAGEYKVKVRLYPGIQPLVSVNVSSK